MPIDRDPILWPETPFLLEKHLVMSCLRGSIAHGLYVPPEEEMGTDDIDILGVVVPPKEHYFKVQRNTTWEGAESIQPPWDTLLYEYRKYVRLLCQQNPNILSSLWLDEIHYIHRSWQFILLQEKRDLFRAKKPAYDVFRGYTNEQLRRMISGEGSGGGRGMCGKKRLELRQRFGYDTKNAAHLIRLLRMGIEYLQDGVLRVTRSNDREELLAIKQGQLTLDDIQKLAKEHFKQIDTAYETSPLPECIDYQAVQDLVTDTLFTTLAR